MKTILITGASSGIGQAVVERFAFQGVCLLLVGRNQEKLQHRARKLPGKNQLKKIGMPLFNGDHQLLFLIQRFRLKVLTFLITTPL